MTYWRTLKRRLWISPLGLAVFFAGIGLARIVSTYATLTHTFDEPLHIACGLEWLLERRYTYEPQHPPLTRAVAAVGASWAGAKNVRRDDFLVAHKLLYAAPSYERALSWARAGELPFFALGAVVIWLWTKRLFDEGCAAAAVLLYTANPCLLAHAGLATTDIGLAAMTIAACYAWQRWLDTAGWRTTLVAAAAISGGALSKFTFLLFFPVGAIGLLVTSGNPWRMPRVSRLGWTSGLAGLILLLIWAGYWFDITPVPTSEGPGGFIPHLPGVIQKRLTAQPEVAVPAGAFYEGLVRAKQHNFEGHQSFLLGETRRSGWWYFFPVVLFFKTPIAMLVLLAIGVMLAMRGPWREAGPVVCAALMLLAAMPGSVNLGVRHVLPVAALGAIPGGVALCYLLRSSSRIWMRGLAGVLLIWLVTGSMTSHPNYLAYFNEFAQGAPERIRVDSDLDWGQNVELVRSELRLLLPGEKVGLRLYSTADLYRHGLAINGNYIASAWKPMAGWTAISATDWIMHEPAPAEVRAEIGDRKPWWWLDGVRPVRRLANGTVLLFWVSESHVAGLR